MKTQYGDRFTPGDKVLFHGLRAKVCEFPVEKWESWAVPIEINGSMLVTIAHADAVSIRGRKARI